MPRRLEENHECVGVRHGERLAAGCLIPRENPNRPYERLNEAPEIVPAEVRQ